jgi:hypothetical protein
MPITVLDPTLAPAAAPARLAPGLRALTGARVGLLDNGKANVDRFLDQVADVLRTAHGVGEIVRLRKPNMSAPAPDAMLDTLAACDAVISAVGD